jgi:hypothetical protein
MTPRRTAALLLALLALAALLPAAAHAASGEALPIPWLDEVVADLLASLVKVLQDLMKGVGILLWAVLKLCGIAGLLGSDFSSLFGSVVIEAINAVVSGSLGAVIRGSLSVSTGLLGSRPKGHSSPSMAFQGLFDLDIAQSPFQNLHVEFL